MRDNEYCEIKSSIMMENPNLIYDVRKVNADNISETYILQRGADKIEPTGAIISSNARLVKFCVVSQNGKTPNTVICEIDQTQEITTKTDEILQVIAKCANDKDDSIRQYVKNQLINIFLDKNKKI